MNYPNKSKAVSERHKKRFYEIMKEVHPTLRVIGIHQGGKIPIEFLCTICNTSFKNKPSLVVGQKYSGCPTCSIRERSKKRSNTCTDKKYAKIKKHFDKCELITFKGLTQEGKVKLKCKNCKTEWEAYTNSALNYVKGGCRSCSTKRAATDRFKVKADNFFLNNTEFKLIKVDETLNSFECICLECKNTCILKRIHIRYKHTPCKTCMTQTRLRTSKKIIKKVSFRGKTFKVVGNEDKALLYLVNERKIKPRYITEKCPSIPYRYNKKSRYYIPDLYIENQNLLVEVKSLFTLGIICKKGYSGKSYTLCNVKAKAKACIKAGYNFELLVMHPKTKQMIKLPDLWYMYPNKIIRNKLLQYIENII